MLPLQKSDVYSNFFVCFYILCHQLFLLLLPLKFLPSNISICRLLFTPCSRSLPLVSAGGFSSSSGPEKVQLTHPALIVRVTLTPHSCVPCTDICVLTPLHACRAPTCVLTPHGCVPCTDICVLTPTPACRAPTSVF